MLGGDEPDFSIPLNMPDSAESLVFMLVILAIVISMIGSGLNGLQAKWKTFWGPVVTFTLVIAVALVWSRIRDGG